MDRQDTDKTTRRALLASGLALAAMPPAAAAQDFPAQPVTLVVGFFAGGGTDTYARAPAEAMAEPLGVPALVVDQEGATGTIAAQAVAGAAPDGCTLRMASAGSPMVKAIYDGADAAVQPLEDLAVIGRIGASITGPLVPADSPFQTAADLVAAAEADPDALRWPHPGRGSLFQLSGVAFLPENGIAVADVPFGGGGPARDAVAAGQVEFGFMGIPLKNGFEKRIRAFGIAGDERDPANPQGARLWRAGPARDRADQPAGRDGADGPARGRDRPARGGGGGDVGRLRRDPVRRRPLQRPSRAGGGAGPAGGAGGTLQPLMDETRG